MNKIKKIIPQDTPKHLKGPLTGEKPLYLYLSPRKDFLLYTEDLKELLNASEVRETLEIWEEGISFLLQTGIVLTPYTIYKNLSAWYNHRMAENSSYTPNRTNNNE
ncbi:MAG: hypothetical protein ACK4UR_02990 [Caldimicrobium sp.]